MTDTTPTTEAGKRLLGAIRSGVIGIFADDYPGDPSPIPAAIAAIEAEARAQTPGLDALREAAQETLDATDAYLDSENQFTESRLHAVVSSLDRLRAALAGDSKRLVADENVDTQHE